MIAATALYASMFCIATAVVASGGRKGIPVLMLECCSGIQNMQTPAGQTHIGSCNRSIALHWQASGSNATHLEGGQHEVTLLLLLVAMDRGGAELPVQVPRQLVAHALGGAEDEDAGAAGEGPANRNTKVGCMAPVILTGGQACCLSVTRGLQRQLQVCVQDDVLMTS